MSKSALVRFNAEKENSFYFCLAFALKHRNGSLPASLPGKKSYIRRLKNQILSDGIVDSLLETFPELTIETLTDVEMRYKIRINIFSRQKWADRAAQGSLRLARDSDLPGNEETSELNIFSHTYDGFSDFGLDRLDFILDKESFLKQFGFVNKKRSLTIFEILAHEKNPDIGLESQEMYQKVLEYQRIWEHPTVRIDQHRKFHHLFGYGLEIWQRVRNRNRVETFKVVESLKSKNLRICIKGDVNIHEFSIQQVRVLT